MLRELLDLSFLEDFVRGLARASTLRISIYDSRGSLITSADAQYDFTRRVAPKLDLIPTGLRLVPVPADAPPAHVGFMDAGGVWSVVAPVYIDGKTTGYVGVGEFREHVPSGDFWSEAAKTLGMEMSQAIKLWEALPKLERSGHSLGVVTARWTSRMLGDWGRRETHLQGASDEMGLIGDIAELLTGEHDLQRVLDRIVAETARVMKCRFSSLRLYDPATNELKNKAVYNLSDRYLNKGAILRGQSGIDDEALRGQLVYVENAATDPRVLYPEDASREGIVSMLTAGMIYRGSPVGVIRVYTDRKQRFRAAQKNLLRAVAYQAATAIVHAQLVEERLKAAETERELALAGALQQRMIRQPPRHARIDAAMVHSPRRHVGGDYCDFMTLGDGRYAAVIADVVGKGIPASLLMASTRGALRAIASESNDLGEILTRLNRHVAGETAASEFVTLLMIAIDAQRGRLGYANAGHEPPLVLRDGSVLSLDEGDLVLGISPSVAYMEYSTELRPRDFVLLSTDGATEAMNFNGDLFGRERLQKSLTEHGLLSADQCIRSIRWDLRRFRGLAQQSDDLTLVGVRITGDS